MTFRRNIPISFYLDNDWNISWIFYECEKYDFQIVYGKFVTTSVILWYFSEAYAF